jgi:Protein of unknown function (DUF2510)
MSSPGFDQIFLAPLVATVITTVAVAGREWARGRQKEAQGLRNLDLATRKLAYFDAWFTLYERANAGQPAPELRAIVEPELQSARQLAERGWVDAQRAPRWTFGRIKTYVLLTDVKGSFGVHVLKFLYWISLLSLIFIVPIFIGVTLFPPAQSLNRQEPLGARILAALFEFFILGIAPVVILRTVAKRRSRVATQREAIPNPLEAPDSDAKPSGSSPPAGWYSDPQSPAVRRYWNGAGWTEGIAP